MYDLIEEYRVYQTGVVKEPTYHRNYFSCERAKEFLGADTLVDCLNAGYIRMTVEKWKLVTQVMVLSGLRVGESIALERSDVDFKKNTIHVTKTYSSITQTVSTPKTRCSIRDVYMQDELRVACKALRNYTLEQNLMNGVQSSLLICDSNGYYMNFYSEVASTSI